MNCESKFFIFICGYNKDSFIHSRLKLDSAEHLIVINCFAHRFKLAIKDVVKQNSYMATVNDFFNKSFKFYKNSALTWSGLEISGTALGPWSASIQACQCGWLPVAVTS